MGRPGAHAQPPIPRPELAAVVLAAGEGRRLAPLTGLRPKPLCPVGGVPLIDLALERVRPLAVPVAVNLHHGADALRHHLDGPGRPAVHLSEEQPEALGTAGALGALRGWLDGRAALVVNADAWAPGSLEGFVAAWDGRRCAVLVHGDDRFGPRALVAGALLPGDELAALRPEPSGLYEVVWRRRAAEGALQVVRHDGPFVDCGTPVDYLRANRWAAASAGGALVDPSAEVTGSVEGASVIGAGARVEGRVVDAVVWPGAAVGADEVLVRSVRADGLTVGPLDDGWDPPA